MSPWCEHCRDHFDVDHYDEEGDHKVGEQYGIVGSQMAHGRWCEHCRDWYDVSHYDENGFHRKGREYGPVGERKTRIEELEAKVDRYKAEADAWRRAFLKQEAGYNRLAAAVKTYQEER